MSHFYGTLKGARGEATRRGHKTTGIHTIAASWCGGIGVSLYVDEQGRDCFRVEQIRWHGAGVHELLAEGVLGQPTDCGVSL